MVGIIGNSGQLVSSPAQTGTQQAAVQQQNNDSQRAVNNKPQGNRSAELATSQRSNQGQNSNFVALAESILANRQSGDLQPAAQRGQVLDIVV